jgi:hypothetical protein
MGQVRRTEVTGRTEKSHEWPIPRLTRKVVKGALNKFLPLQSVSHKTRENRPLRAVLLVFGRKHSRLE